MKTAARFVAPLVLLAAVPTGLAAPVTLTLNGQPTTLTTTVLNGKTYVLLDDLKKVLTASGGANQKASVEGCVNEWLFNGVVRMRVTKVEPTYQDKGEAYPGYAVTAEFKNGTSETLRLDDVGMTYNNAASVTFADGNSWNDLRGVGNWQDKTYARIQQGGGTVFTFRLYSEEQLPKNQPLPPAQKFLLEVKNKVSSGLAVRYSVPDPSFRVNLTCTK